MSKLRSHAGTLALTFCIGLHRSLPSLIHILEGVSIYILEAEIVLGVPLQKGATPQNGGTSLRRGISGPKKNSLNIKFLGGIFLGHPGPRRRDIPDKNFMEVALSCCFRQGVAGMSRDLGRDVPDLEKLYARKLRAD